LFTSTGPGGPILRTPQSHAQAAAGNVKERAAWDLRRLLCLTGGADSTAYPGFCGATLTASKRAKEVRLSLSPC
jgi:hypothetical protein